MTEIKFNPGSVELYKTIVKPGLETKVSGDTKEDSNGVKIPPDVFTSITVNNRSSGESQGLTFEDLASPVTEVQKIATTDGTDASSEPGFDFAKLAEEVGLDINAKYASYEELMAATNDKGENIVEQFRIKYNEYILEPRDKYQDLSSLTREQEKELVDEIMGRVNEVATGIMKGVPGSYDGNDPQGDSSLRSSLRAGLFFNLERDARNNVKANFEELPSFKGQGRQKNIEVLAKEFGYVSNITNSDINNLVSWEQLTSGESEFSSRQPEKLKAECYEAFVKIDGERAVPEELRDALQKSFPGINPENFETIYETNSPSFTFRGATMPLSNDGVTVASASVINPANIDDFAAKAGMNPEEKERMVNGIIINELVHRVANNHLPPLNQDESAFGNYEDAKYQKMSNLQYSEINTERFSALIDPEGALVRSTRSNDGAFHDERYFYNAVFANDFLAKQGFSQDEIASLTSVDETARYDVMEALVKNKGLDYEKLAQDFATELGAFRDDLTEHLIQNYTPPPES